MPTTINGIGTQYYGKKNPHVYHGTCDSCGFTGELTDYETGYYFVVIFIPLIPLGKKQIIGECPGCSRHRVMALHEWKRVSEEAVQEGMAGMAESPDDPDAALQLLGTMTTFNRVDEAIEFAGAMQGTFAENVDVQLALGGWYDQYQRSADANACYERAMALDPEHPGCIRAKGFDLMQAGELEQAGAMFEKLKPPSEHFDPLLFVLLAYAYQEKTDHASAYEIFKFLMGVSPDIQEDDDFRKKVRLSEKALGITESIVRKESYGCLIFMVIAVVAIIGFVIAIAMNG